MDPLILKPLCKYLIMLLLFFTIFKTRKSFASLISFIILPTRVILKRPFAFELCMNISIGVTEIMSIKNQEVR